jgi:hypothetical protein
MGRGPARAGLRSSLFSVLCLFPESLRSRDFATLKFGVCNKTYIALHNFLDQVEGIGHGNFKIGGDVYFFAKG